MKHFKQGAAYKTYLTWPVIEESNDLKVEKAKII